MSKLSKNKPSKIGQSRILKENLLYSGNWTELIEFK